MLDPRRRIDEALEGAIQILYEMGIKEKEHEVYFLERIKSKKLLPLFEKLFGWGAEKSFNNIDLDKKYPAELSDLYCKVKEGR